MNFNSNKYKGIGMICGVIIIIIIIIIIVG